MSARRDALTDRGPERVARLTRELERRCAAAPELDPWREEPGQMPSGAVGKRGFLRLAFRRGADGRSELWELDRRVPLLAQKALYWDEAMPDMPCVFVITTSGCLVQGDRMILDIQVGPGATAHVTTQAATKIHMMDANHAAQMQLITVEDDGYLEYLPDPLIPHRTARYFSDTRIRLGRGASCLYWETLLPGRRHHHADERFGFDLYSARLEAVDHESGKLLAAEKMLLEPRRHALDGIAAMNGYEVFGSALLLTEKAAALKVREAVGVQVAGDAPAFGASLLPGGRGLSFRVLGRTSREVGEILRRFQGVAREVITGCALSPAFLWR